MIKQTYINMGQLSGNYHIDPATKAFVSSNNVYYDFLKNEKYSIGGEEDV